MGERSKSWEYCQQTLPKVSRTFALNIGVLRGDLHRSMLLVYLICRTVDTVEDSPSLPANIKVRFLGRFPQIFEEESWEMSLQEWIDGLIKAGLDGAPADVDLLRHGRDVIGCFKQLPRQYQLPGEKLFGIMSNGMADIIERFPDERIALKDVPDLELYCYYVAGSVGEFLQEAFYQTCKIPEYRTEEFKKLCISYGLGLQMTNIAKDIYKDYQRGQRFFPHSFLENAGIKESQFLSQEKRPQMLEAYKSLLKLAHTHLNNGYTLVKVIRRRHVRIRLFCLWPLWMAFETLRSLTEKMDLLYSAVDIKITRQQVKGILRSTTLMAPSNTLLECAYRRRYQNLQY